ncbi:MAG: hypothetical protein GX433_00850 [Deltaproteobacteria bacterium]|jgi:hypothetical protein|nr:hypothetical protein [Deltaproteobacteria bacterium]
MGKVIDFFQYKKMETPEPIDGTYMEVAPPIIILRHFKKGAMVKEERVVSEYMLRELLERMP